MSFASTHDFLGTSRFQVVRQLGQGGMGVVYEAIDRHSGDRVALKTLRSFSPDGLLRFKQEFRVLQDLGHPNLISLRELIADDRAGWFFTMELIEGPTFLEHVRRAKVDAKVSEAATVEIEPPPPTGTEETQARSFDGQRFDGARFDETVLRDVMAQLVRGLLALHATGKIHRDIKPSNVLVDSRGASPRVVVLDFGLAVDHARAPQIDAIAAHDGEPRTIAGTVDYMSPEQAAGHALGPESDWYSVGVMLYEALTGTVPFDGPPLEVLLTKQRRAALPPRAHAPHIPADLDALCADLIRFVPSERPNGSEILARLGGRAEVRRNSPQSGSLSHRFVGRDHELESLVESFEQLRIGRGSAALVVGESGVGKSALVRRFLEEARGQVADVVVLYGRCYERETVPYKALDGAIDALSQHLLKRPAGELEQILPDNAPLLAEVFPVLSRVPAIASAPAPAHRILDPIERRDRVFAALRELLARLAARHPILLVIDDLQWSDADSRALLAELLRPPGAPPLLLVATLRPASDGTPFPSAALPGPVSRIELGRLPADAALRLAEHLARTVAPDRELALPALVAEADGHPLFLDELIRFCATTPEASTRPVQLEDALRARIEELDPGARQLLEILAMAGRPISQQTAAQATGLGPAFANHVALLRVAHLIRTTGMRGTDRIETFHDRVLAAAAAGVSPDQRREHHRCLAVAFETSQQVDAESQMVHWNEAGDRVKAAHYAQLAAAQADRALAFDRAARLYQRCLDLSGHEDEAARRGLLICLGDSLTNSGRAAESAEAYLEAAKSGNTAEALDLRRRAAEALLRSGRISEGISVVEAVLGAVGMHLAPTPVRALASVLYRRARIRMRGLSFTERDESELAMADLTRIDVCWSVGTGLAFVDTIRGADFQARNLLLSLDAGEPYRVARALCLESMFSAAGGAKNQARTQRLLEASATLADRVKRPHLDGLRRMVEGVCCFLVGRYPDALRILREAEQIFLDRCTGVHWELASTQPFILWSQYFLGQLRELSRGVPVLEAAAQKRGDLYALTNLRTEFVSFAALLRDDPTTAQQAVHDAMGSWTNEGVHLEHFWELHASAQIELYLDQGVQAYDRVAGLWRALKRALILDIEQVRIESLYLRGRSALTAARQAPGRRAELIAAGKRDAEALLAERSGWARPLGQLLSASVAATNGDTAGGLALAAQADSGFTALGMALHRNAARWRRGELLGGSDGDQLIAEARGWFVAQEVRRPERLVALLTPPLASG